MSEVGSAEKEEVIVDMEEVVVVEEGVVVVVDEGPLEDWRKEG